MQCSGQKVSAFRVARDVGRPIDQKDGSVDKSPHSSAEDRAPIWKGSRKVKIAQGSNAGDLRNYEASGHDEGRETVSFDLPVRSVAEAKMIAHGLHLVERENNQYSFEGISSIHAGFEQLMMRQTGKKTVKHADENRAIYQPCVMPND